MEIEEFSMTGDVLDLARGKATALRLALGGLSAQQPADSALALELAAVTAMAEEVVTVLAYAAEIEQHRAATVAYAGLLEPGPTRKEDIN
jgi:hypothetical protein